MDPIATHRILVICLRRLGDVLLSTPLIRSLRRAYPQAEIHALVFASTAAALEGNPDLDRIIAWPSKPGPLQTLRLALPLLRRYDLACAVTASDRAQLIAAWAARRRAVAVQGGFARPWLNPVRVTYAPGRLHTVTQALRLAEALAITPVAEVVPPRTMALQRIEAMLGADWSEQSYAVVHPAPMFRYKAWTLDAWRGLIESLLARGLHVVLSGGPAASEQALVTSLMAAAPAAQKSRLANVAGSLSLAELAQVLERAAVFIGPDTSVTHLASACGTPVIALFGPSSPVAWGPWPKSGVDATEDSPWCLTAPRQQRENVTILQGTNGRFGACIPCLQEGCERHQNSVSDCLEQLPLARVLAAIDCVLPPAAR